MQFIENQAAKDAITKSDAQSVLTHYAVSIVCVQFRRVIVFIRLILYIFPSYLLSIIVIAILIFNKSLLNLSVSLFSITIAT